MKKSIITILTIGLLMSGCNNNGNNNSNSNSNYNSIQSSVVTSDSSSSSIFEGYKDIDVVLSNTRYYGLRYTNSETRYIEINLENMFYSTFQSNGYVVLDSDPEFLHTFTTYYDPTSDNYDVCMDVHGRATNKENIAQLETRNIIHIIANYIDSFTKVRDDLWRINSRDFCYDLSNFFQMKSLRYCTVVELTIGRDNRIKELLIYEESTFPIYSKILVFTGVFDNITREKVDMYDRWVKKGSVINERVLDYKMLYTNNNISVYNNENLKFEATVVSKDSNGNVYVAHEAKNKENVGIKVVPSNDCSAINIGDIVEVQGKVVTNNFVVSITNATVKDTNKDAAYPPIFDEEVIVDSYGGGIYAATYFSSIPYYSGSVYSTYAYVKELPNVLNENGDTFIDVICPKFTNEDDIYQMRLILPSSLDLNKRIELFEELKNGGIYGEEGAYELNLEQFVIEFDPSYYYGVKLLATDYTDVSKRLNAQEKVEKYLGLTDFPIVNQETIISYKFGGSSGYYLESQYGIDGNSTQGIYIGYSKITSQMLNDFLATLEEYGATLFNVIKDYGSGKHYIYKMNNVYIDVQYMIGQSDEEGGTLNSWLYTGELLRCTTINEQLEEAIPWFNNEDFEVLEGTYDYDYTLFKLYDYANNSYSLDNPLHCVTIDTQENIMDAFNLKLIQKGYTQYMEGNMPYMYRTRGQDHYVFEKGGVFVDVACYHTSDYTYSGHDEYEYRLEVLIYQGNKPISVKTYENLDFLSNLYAQENAALAYNVELPEDAVVEIWRDLKNYKLSPVDYGYGCRDEAFIYTEDIDSCYESIKQALIDAGYKIGRESDDKSCISFSITVDGNNYFIGMFKEPEKGYVRFMNSVLGVSFSRW